MRRDRVPSARRASAFWPLILSSSVLLISSPARAEDPLRDLIEKEEAAESAWLDREPMPEAYLLGDRAGVEVYSSATYGGDSSPVCDPMPYDELIQLSGRSPADSAPVNTALPRVRDLIGRFCRIRPGDVLIAVGPGWHKRVTVSGFQVRTEPPVCPGDAAHAFWATVEPALPDAPFFFSTNLDLPEGDNAYAPLTVRRPPRRQEIALLSQHLPLLGDFDVTALTVEKEEAATLFELRRRVVASGDSGLPSDLVVWARDPVVQTVWVERIDARRGTGRARAEAVFDVNGDGERDLIVSGTHERCPYRVFFDGGVAGFTRLSVPRKPCRC